MAGDQVTVDAETGVIEDRSSKKKFQAEPIPPFMQELISDGGLIAHIKKVQGPAPKGPGKSKTLKRKKNE
jgi:hypothetical protein